MNLSFIFYWRKAIFRLCSLTNWTPLPLNQTQTSVEISWILLFKSPGKQRVDISFTSLLWHKPLFCHTSKFQTGVWKPFASLVLYSACFEYIISQLNKKLWYRGNFENFIGRVTPGKQRVDISFTPLLWHVSLFWSHFKVSTDVCENLLQILFFAVLCFEYIISQLNKKLQYSGNLKILLSF